MDLNHWLALGERDHGASPVRQSPPTALSQKVDYFCAESAAGSREPPRNRLGAESALADALGYELVRTKTESSLVHWQQPLRTLYVGQHSCLLSTDTVRARPYYSTELARLSCPL